MAFSNCQRTLFIFGLSLFLVIPRFCSGARYFIPQNVTVEAKEAASICSKYGGRLARFNPGTVNNTWKYLKNIIPSKSSFDLTFWVDKLECQAAEGKKLQSSSSLDTDVSGGIPSQGHYCYFLNINRNQSIKFYMIKNSCWSKKHCLCEKNLFIQCVETETRTFINTAEPITLKATTEPSTVKATTEPSTGKPTSKPSPGESTANPQTQKPATESSTEKPTSKPPIQKPSRKPQTQRPATKLPPGNLISESPTSIFTSESSHAQQNTEPANAQPNTEPPRSATTVSLITEPPILVSLRMSFFSKTIDGTAFLHYLVSYINSSFYVRSMIECSALCQMDVQCHCVSYSQKDRQCWLLTRRQNVHSVSISRKFLWIKNSVWCLVHI